MQLVRKDSEKDKPRTPQSRESAIDMPEAPLPESAGGGEFPPEASPRLSSLTPKPFSYGRNAKGHKRFVGENCLFHFTYSLTQEPGAVRMQMTQYLVRILALLLDVKFRWQGHSLAFPFTFVIVLKVVKKNFSYYFKSILIYQGNIQQYMI